MAKLRTQNDGATANHLTPAERAAIGGYRAGGTDPKHYRAEYDRLHRAYSLPECHIYHDAAGELVCKVISHETDTPHPGTLPRVFARLTELVDLLLDSPAVAQQATLF
ncbi:MAG: hypothetical protein ACRYFZ_00870 [Janthinobacterium lividum]